MVQHADHLLDRIKLKQQLMQWRTGALLALLVLALVLISQGGAGSFSFQQEHIARLHVEGMILDSPRRDAMIKKIRENDQVKALIVRLDTPGGTGAGGQQLYESLRSVAEKKPVIALMRTMATSAGYMTALAADHIIAQESTITGSIGVILQSFNVEKLAEEYGVKPIILKSGENKGSPSTFEPTTREQRVILQSVIDDFHRYFVNLVAERRAMEPGQAATLSDGRVYSGRQALNARLVDQLGGEEEALAWLAAEHGITTDTILNHRLKKDAGKWWEGMKQLFGGNPVEFPSLGLDGLLLIWQPRANFIN